MILKKREKIKRKYNINKFLLTYFILSITSVLVFLSFIITSDRFIGFKNKSLDILSKGGRYEYIYLPNIIFSAIKSNFYDLKKINLEINFKNSLILENIRNQAIENGSLPGDNLNTRVNFTLNHENKNYKGEIRLKGDRAIHFEDKEKSSYKIELDKNNYIFGVSKFSLQKPRVRNYIHEWIFHQMSKDFDLIKIKYKFLDLFINGEDKGLYVLEEGFGVDLIERNKRRNGPIFGINENLSRSDKDPVFEIYNKKYWAKEENKKLLENASQKLRNFFNKKIKLEDVFDVNRWASFFAVVDFTSTFHGAFLWNVKLYYNPINGLFEPIPFDGHRINPNYHKFNLNYDDRLLVDFAKTGEIAWLRNFFYKKNSINEEFNYSFYNLYLKKLRIISSAKYLDKFLKKNHKKIKQINSHIYADYFFYDNSNLYTSGIYYFLLSDFFRRADVIKNKLDFKNGIQIIKKADNSYVIKNFYKNYVPIEITNIVCNDNGNIKKINIKKNLNIFSETFVNANLVQNKNVKCRYLNFRNKLDGSLVSVKIDHVNSEHNFENFKMNNMNKWTKYFNKKGKKLFLTKNINKIDENIYIPKGFEVNILPGQKILLLNGAFIFSNSNWKVGGKEKQTIIGGLKDNLGGGLIVLDNDNPSEIVNTKFSYLGGFNLKTKSEYLILGAINFHQTEIYLDNLNFENIFSEDAVNIFRSDFKIKNSNYKNISSDAIDIDFSSGKIEQTTFQNISNDAMDFSGSNVDINQATFDNVQDKLISGGEESTLEISNINATNSWSGIISKDGSKLFSKKILFKNVQIPFASYQKKPQYNHGYLNVSKFKIENYLVKFAKDKKSEIILGKENLISNKINEQMIKFLNQ